MVDIAVEKTEPDPSATSIGNSQTVNTSENGALPEAPNQTLDNDALIEDKSTKTENAAAVETEGHEAPAEKGTNTESKKDSVTSDKVREGQKWNNRNRSPKNFKRNVKSDLTSQPVSSDAVEIRKQVEFYFSDSNLMSDNFLYSKVEGHQNLPVPISIIHSFKRMRHFQPYSAVVDALKESEILDVTDNDSCIQRKVPIPEHLKDKPMVEIQKVYEDAAMARSVYVKGFGEEMPSTQFDIEAFFAEYGSTNSVRLRRHNNKVFKGSVFVEFDSEATQKAFLALEPKPKWKGNDLAIKSKKQYCDEKVDDIRAGKVRPLSGDRPSSHRDKRGDNDNRDWRIRRDEDSKSGFKDRSGGRHKGFGSAGRGRGGGRGRGRDGDGRDRNGRDRNDAKKEGGDENNPAQPKSPAAEHITKENGTATTAEKPHDTIMPDTAPVISTEPASKKREREDNDNGAAEQGSAKKVDMKEGDS